MKRPCLLPVVIIAVAFIAGGCARSVTFDSWRQSVETYVREQGGGDPAVLRELYVDPAHRGVRVFSADRPSQSTDITGVLVGSARVSGHPWMVFLVGLIDRQNVRDIRVAALTVRENQYIWQMGAADDKAVKTYLRYNQDLAHHRFPDRSAPAEYAGFPREEDRFELATQGDSIDVTHAPSGARWRVLVTDRR